MYMGVYMYKYVCVCISQVLHQHQSCVNTSPVLSPFNTKQVLLQHKSSANSTQVRCWVLHQILVLGVWCWVLHQILVLGARCSVLGARCSVLHQHQILVLGARCSVFGARCSVLHLISGAAPKLRFTPNPGAGADLAKLPSLSLLSTSNPATLDPPNVTESLLLVESQKI